MSSLEWTFLGPEISPLPITKEKRLFRSDGHHTTRLTLLPRRKSSQLRRTRIRSAETARAHAGAPRSIRNAVGPNLYLAGRTYGKRLEAGGKLSRKDRRLRLHCSSVRQSGYPRNRLAPSRRSTSSNVPRVLGCRAEFSQCDLQ